MVARPGIRIGLGLALVTLLAAGMVAAATMGYLRIPAADVLAVIGHRLFGHGPAPGPVVVAVVADVRLPRILAAVLALAAGDRRLSSTSLILAGVIVAAILSAAIGFLKFLADEQVGAIIFWLMGSLSGVSWPGIIGLSLAALAGGAVCLVHGRDLNVMATGERAAATLGVRTARLRWLLLVVCSLMTALCVSVSGIIGFVGLIVPHLLRYLVGPDNRWLMALSLPAGGLLLLAADTLTRAVLPAEVPIGVLTALIGGPFFCVIFRRRQQNGTAGF